MAVRSTASPLLGLLLLFPTWGAWAMVQVNMEDRVEVFRGDTAQIACMFNSEEGIGALTLMWFYKTRLGEREQIYFQDSTVMNKAAGTPFTERITVNVTNGQVLLTINEVRLEDELEFICVVKILTEGSGEGSTQLRVFEIPNPPTIDGVAGVSVLEEEPSKIAVCEVTNGFPKPNITWYKNNNPLRSEKDGVEVVYSTTSESSGLFSVKSELSLKVMKEDKDAEFYCEVIFFVPGQTRMRETNRIKINVYYPSTAVNLWVESPKGKIKEGDSIEFHCQGNGNMPSVYTIAHNGEDQPIDVNVLVLNNVTRRNSGVYECISQDMDTFEETSGNITVVVNYLDPAVVIPEDIVLAQEEKLTATCNALSSLQTHTVWFKEGKEVSRAHTLTLEDVTFDTAGEYVCVVTVPDIVGMETMGKLQVDVTGPPKIARPDNTEIEESLETSVDLSCSVRGFPAPDVTWTTSDGKSLEPFALKTTKEGFLSVVSVKVTSDVTAFCNASNDHGTDSVAFNIKAIRAATAIPPKKIKKEGSGVIIAVIIICILLLAILGSVLYFLYKKGKICGRSGKQDLTKDNSNKDSIVVEMKSDNTEEAILLGVNGEKLHPSDQ